MKRFDGEIRRAALYIRVSTEDQATHGISLEAQQARLEEYCRDNDLYIVDIYRDEGISARKRYTRRPELLRLIEDIKKKKVDIVLFVKLDRWFRNLKDYFEVQSILDKYKVEWLATDENYSTTSANDRLLLNLKLAINQDEADRTSERIKFVFKNRLKEGYVISGTAPFGFKIENKRPVIDERTAPIRKAVYDIFLDCRSKRETCRRILDQYGIAFDPKTVKALIQDEKSIGINQGVKGWCPAIVDEETFKRANELINLRSQRNSYERTDKVYLFTSLVFCSECGRRMTTYRCRNTRKDGTQIEFTYYRCPSYHLKKCSNGKQINEKKLEKWLVDNLTLQAEAFNLSTASKPRAKAQKNAVDVKKIERKLSKLKDLYLDDFITKEAYEKDYKALTALLETAKETAAEEPRAIDLRLFKQFDQLYSTLDPQGKKTFWSRTIKKIIVTPNGEFFLTFNQS